MPQPIKTPDRLFDRTWRPGHPYRPRLSGKRRAIMIVLFLLLSGLIGAYRYFTNADRVRQQAEQYLTRLTGGHVSVRRATLSIFEGLRLDEVHVYVDPAKTQDSLIFSASTFLIQYSPAVLLQGRIEATRIVAIDPRVRLIENVETHEWNYSQLSPRKREKENKNLPRVLPEISLRNGMVDYLETGKPDPIGSVSIDGMFSPDKTMEHYGFKLQSRGGQFIGPRAEGNVAIATGEMNGTLYDLQFGKELRVMLPAQVQNWWRDHGLAGSVKRTELWMDPSAPGAHFKATIIVEDIGMTVQPQELISREEMQRRIWTRQAFDVMRAAGLDQHGFVSHLSSSLDASPIALTNVDGKFTFTQEGVDIDNLTATVEENRLAISGHYAGYSNDAAASLKLTNAPGHELIIPAKPKFVNSLPAEVREAYTRFRPQGTGEVWVQYIRPSQGARPEVTCEVKVNKGNFTFDRFPYPIHKAKGTISVTRDENTGEERLRIQGVRGYGRPGGPNENALIEVDGEMGPFTPAIEVVMNVRGKNISSEPALLAAFPPKTRQALKYFDAAGKGEFPKFRGNFACSIHRMPQTHSQWDVKTSIHLADAAGSLVAFPYPMDHVSGDLVIGEDHMEITEARMKRDGADLLLKGRVGWASDAERTAHPTTNPTLRPNLSITAHNVPIDEALIHALPPLQAKWLQRLSAKGTFDLTGQLSDARTSGPDFTFDVSLHDCDLWAVAGKYAVSKLNGALKLTPQKMILTDLHGKRGDADVSARGEISWPTSPPLVSVVAEASNLALDDALFSMLPESAKKGWATVQPEGTVDAKITFSGEPAETAVASTVDVMPTTQPQRQNFELILHPRSLSITPKPVPYRLDDLAGAITITPASVRIQDVTGHHGGAQVRFSGTGSTDPNGAWEFNLTGQKMLLDDDLKKAIPTGMQSVLQFMQMQGEVAFEFSKLKVWNDSIASAALGEKAVPTTAPGGNFSPISNPISNTAAMTSSGATAIPGINTGPPATAGSAGGASTALTNADFAMRLSLADASLNPGVPLAKVNGEVSFTGASRHGKLTELAGSFNLPNLEISGRPATNFRAELVKRSNQDAMKLAQIQAQLVGGQLAGQIEWTYPDTGPSRYAMSLVLHNADIKTLTADTMPEARGALSASLSMDGNFDDPSSRRGGGDVALSGEQLYKIPLVLGLLQITNLALPITSPFNEGACKYSIDGVRVTFESIELRAKEMMISGNGHLDFDTGRVGMSFTSQNTAKWLKVPVVNDLLQSARNELLTIHVRGTIKQPEVSGSSMNTLMTTVDEVFKGGKPPPDLPPVKKPKKQK